MFNAEPIFGLEPDFHAIVHLAICSAHFAQFFLQFLGAQILLQHNGHLDTKINNFILMPIPNFSKYFPTLSKKRVTPSPTCTALGQKRAKLCTSKTSISWACEAHRASKLLNKDLKKAIYMRSLLIGYFYDHLLSFKRRITTSLPKSDSFKALKYA
jgi:hypothetical protein